MSQLGVGEIIYNLRRKIQDIQLELDELSDPVLYLPELITSANLLRSNEYLVKVSKKQSELLSAYNQYSLALEDMIATVFDIQNDLKNLLKEQLRLISDEESSRSNTTPKKRKSKLKRKPSKK